VLPILARYGYATKADACFLQCFDFDEVRRLRTELGWRGRLIMLIELHAKADDGTDFNYLCSAAGLKELAKFVDGIGPPFPRLFSWRKGGQLVATDLARLAHAERLAIHPYTVRIDDLPRNCPNADALHAALFREAHVEGVFTDFTDVTIAWLRANATTARGP
jgi:glycerophosphoryl diester phosphodiesterase